MKLVERAFLPDEQATLDYARVLRPYLQPGALVFLHGELGAGKTTLVRGILRNVQTVAGSTGHVVASASVRR